MITVMSNHDLVSILATTLSLPSDSPAQLEALNQLSIILVADSAKLIVSSYHSECLDAGA